MPTTVKVVKKPDDPLALRLSAGGGAYGYYAVYRGKLPEVIRCLEAVLGKLRSLKQEPEVDDETDRARH